MELRYCLYARKSTESDERQAMSIDSQIKEMSALARNINIQVTAIKQESHSAKKSATRPIFNELLKDIKHGKFDGILTWAPDRLARNAGDLGTIVDLMDEGKLQKIQTFGQSFSNNPNEKFLLMILGSQAKLENDNKGLTVRRGMRARVALGWRPGNAPIGYMNRSVDGKKDIVTDPKRAEIVREVFERCAIEGQSGRKIKSWLDTIDFRTRRGALLSLSQVYAILQNTFYYGEFEYPAGAGDIYIGSHTPLIDKDLFDAARDRIKEQTNSNTKWGSKDLPYKHIFHCGLCGSLLTVEKQGSYIYYRCSRYTKEKMRCTGKSMSIDQVHRQMVILGNSGKIKRSHLNKRLNDVVDEHHNIMKNILSKKDKAYSSNTRLRDYINYLFTEGKDEDRKIFLKNLSCMLHFNNGKIEVI